MKRIILASLLLSSSTLAMADPGVFFGVGYTFGTKGGPALTLKVLSTKEQDSFAAAAGVSYYPLNKGNPLGFDVGAGYLFDSVAVTVGWDFLHSPQIAAGYVDTEDDNAATPAPPPPTDGPT